MIDTLEKNDEIVIFYNQKKLVYRVTDKVTVKPGDVKALQARDQTKKELSLMTCWPIGTTLERILVFSELIES
jgi:LPXTG-site transpeptidase (sortase) family protein